VLEQLTAYLVTTDREGAAAALACLEEGQGLVHPVVVVRDVRPLAAAYGRTLACPTEYCAVVDDDVLLRPGFLAEALAELIALRARDPRAYQLSGHVFTDDDELIGGAGFKLYHAPTLRRVGFPDDVHVAIAQDAVAEALGFYRAPSKLVVGARHRGPPEDVYKRHLWLQLRWNVCQNPWGRRPRPLHLAARALSTGDRAYALALLGFVDGVLAGFVRRSKDEAYLGPIAAEHGLTASTPAEVLALAAPHAGRFARRYAAILARNLAVRSVRTAGRRLGLLQR